MRYVTAIVELAVVLGACGGSDSSGTTVASQSQPSLEQCQAVPETVVSAIATGLTLEGATLPAGFAIETPSFPGIFWIATELDGPGYEAQGDTPVWVAESVDFGEMARRGNSPHSVKGCGWRRRVCWPMPGSWTSEATPPAIAYPFASPQMGRSTECARRHERL